MGRKESNQTNKQTITGLDNQNFECRIVNIFLLIIFNICFGGSKVSDWAGDVQVTFVFHISCVGVSVLSLLKKC